MKDFNYMNKIAQINAQGASALKKTGFSGMVTPVLNSLKVAEEISQKRKEHEMRQYLEKLKMAEVQARIDKINGGQDSNTTNDMAIYEDDLADGMSVSDSMNHNSSVSMPRSTSLERQWDRMANAGKSPDEIMAMLYPKGAELIYNQRMSENLYKQPTPITGEQSFTPVDMNGSMTSTTGNVGSYGGYQPMVPQAGVNFTPVELPTDIQHHSSTVDKQAMDIAFDTSLSPEQQAAQMISLGDSTTGMSMFPQSYV